MFPDALSTRVTVGNQTVYMMVGLAKKKASGGQSLKDTVPVSSTSGGGGAGGVVTQQIIKDSRGPLCSSATPTTGLVGSRMDYSTDSPLSVSNKAEDVGVARSQRDNVSSNRDESNVGVASSHRNEQVNGLDHSTDPDEEGVVPKAKRIKLMSDEVENIMSGGHNSKQGGGRGDVGGGSDGCVGGGGGDICVGGGGVDVCVGGDSVSKTIKLLNMEDKKSLNRHHHLLSQGHGISPASTATPTSSRTGSPVSMDMPSWNKDGSRDGSSLRWSPSPTPSDHSSTTSSIGHSSSLTSSAGLASSIGHSSSLTSSTVLASSIGHASSLTGSAEQTGQTDPQKYTRTCYWNNCLRYVLTPSLPPSLPHPRNLNDVLFICWQLSYRFLFTIASCDPHPLAYSLRGLPLPLSVERMYQHDAQIPAVPHSTCHGQLGHQGRGRNYVPLQVKTGAGLLYYVQQYPAILSTEESSSLLLRELSKAEKLVLAWKHGCCRYFYHCEYIFPRPVILVITHPSCLIFRRL